MKRLIAIFLLVVLCAVSGFAATESTGKTLVVYFDYSENMGDLTGILRRNAGHGCDF